MPALLFFLNGEYSPFMGWVVGVVLEALNRTRIIQQQAFWLIRFPYSFLIANLTKRTTVLYKGFVWLCNVKPREPVRVLSLFILFK